MHLLHYESAVDPNSESEVIDQSYENDTIYNDDNDSKRTQISLKHFREVSLSAMALPLPVSPTNNNNTLRKADPLISPTTLERAKNSATSPELSRSNTNKTVIQRSVSHSNIAKPMLTLPNILPSPSTSRAKTSTNASPANSTTTSHEKTMSSSSKLGFRKVPELPYKVIIIDRTFITQF